MKRGDILTQKFYSSGKFLNFNFRYRIDPVPFSGKCGGFKQFRKIKTTNERKWNLSVNKKYVRAKRRNIPNTWDDINRTHDKSWKSKKKRKQWM